MEADFIVVTDDTNWMEGNALDQAKALCALSGALKVVAMPDLHAGKTPVGAVVVTDGRIYPHLIGTDIGCGMGMFATGLESKRVKIEKWRNRLNTIKTPAAVPGNRPADCPIADFGSIGSGNHFAEFQAVHEVYDPAGFLALGLNREALYLTVHSGSRGYGSRILSRFSSYDGYDADSDEAQAYCKQHDDALVWVSKNRREAAQKLLDYLGYRQTIESKLECVHNYLERDGGKWYHRKGAVSSKVGPVLIAGTRGDFSYIVRPLPACDNYGFSLSHGAGRKWARSLCKSRIRNKYTMETIRRNRYGGLLVCHDYDLLYEEAPDAYKNVDKVVSILADFGMIERIAALRPVLTFKG